MKLGHHVCVGLPKNIFSHPGEVGATLFQPNKNDEARRKMRGLNLARGWDINIDLSMLCQAQKLSHPALCRAGVSLLAISLRR